MHSLFPSEALPLQVLAKIHLKCQPGELRFVWVFDLGNDIIDIIISHYKDWSVITNAVWSVLRPWNKDFRSWCNSDLILQKAVPGLYFDAQFCDRPGCNEQLYGTNFKACLCYMCHIFPRNKMSVILRISLLTPHWYLQNLKFILKMCILWEDDEWKIKYLKLQNSLIVICSLGLW